MTDGRIVSPFWAFEGKGKRGKAAQGSTNKHGTAQHRYTANRSTVVRARKHDSNDGPECFGRGARDMTE